MTELIKSIFQITPFAIILFDDDGQIHLINHEAEVISGFTRGQLIDQKIDVLFPNLTGKNQRFSLKNQINKIDEFDTEMNTGLGNLKSVTVKKRVFSINDEVWGVASIIDKTELICAEDRFKIAFNAAPNAMLMVDEKGNIILANSAVEKLFGYSLNYLVGKKIELLVPDNVKEHHPVLRRKYFASPSPRPLGVGRDLYGQHKNGSKIPLEIGLHPLTIGKETYVISSVVDISERVRNEQKLKDKNEELDQFAYRTSHDLRSPLMTIQGLSSVIREDIEDGDYKEASRNAEKIENITVSLNQLIEDILCLAQSDYVNESYEKFDFKSFFVKTMSKNEIGLSENKVKLKASFNHDVDLFLQNTRLTILLENLISNAIKYHDIKKEKHFVELKTFNDLDHFYIQVRDNGLGIPEKRHSEVFGMFKKFHNQSTNSSGLGLYLVKKQAQKVGATINFSSEEGEGTSFFIKIPIDPSSRSV